jgi:hypothetical protein
MENGGRALAPIYDAPRSAAKSLAELDEARARDAKEGDDLDPEMDSIPF